MSDLSKSDMQQIEDAIENRMMVALSIVALMLGKPLWVAIFFFCSPLIGMFVREFVVQWRQSRPKKAVQ